eukprot:scaffold2003_cov139-Cylindrotheca_fusiformis.AAC.19
MRFASLISSIALIVGSAGVTSVVAETRDVKQFGTASSRKATFLGAPTSKQKLRSPSFVVKDALSMRAGSSDQKDALTGAVILTLIERATNRVLNAQGINFPSQLGGCIALLVFMLVAEVVSPGLGDAIFTNLSPGSALLAKWLPVFFVPGLAMLPLAPSVGSGMEVIKVLAVVVVGWAFSITTVAFPVLFLRNSQGASPVATPAKAAKKLKRGKASAVSMTLNPSVAPKPYADDTMSYLLKGTVATAILSLAATKTGNDLATPFQSIFLCVGTFATYVWSARLPAEFNKTIHPLISSTVLTSGLIYLTGLATGSEFLHVLKSYKTGTLDLMKTGAGDVLLFLLGPTVVSFAVAIYGKKTLLKENFLNVLVAMLISSGGGLFGTAAFVRLIKLGGMSGRMVRLSVLSRNVTTALSMAIAAILGGDLSIAASVVVMTGIFGATYARRALDALGIQDPITRGLAVGASSQGLGVSTLIGEPDAFPFAAMSMVLTAVSATLLVSVPAIKDALIKVAVGA